MKPSDSPRYCAAQVLNRLHDSDLHADDLIDRELSRGILGGPDRGLFSELVFGVLRRQATLDHYLGQVVEQPLTRLQPLVLTLLRLGVYQLLYLERVPDHAAVHESVELAKQLCPKASGLVNGVLRNLLRQRERLTLPDRSADPATWLAAAHSLPTWLARHWLEQFNLDEAAELAAAALETPPLTLRINTLRISRELYLQRLAEHGVAAEACRYAPEGLRLLERHQVTELPGFREGWFAVQDEASQLVAHLLAPCADEQVLDACAAPGGKTTHLAQLMRDRGLLIATDLNERKIRKIRESSERLGLTMVQAQVADGLQDGYQQGRQFDRILLDAPCSGLGVIRRNPEAKWRLQPADLVRCAERQRALLERVAMLLKPGGVLVYATCSTAPEEDEQVVEDFLSRHPSFVLEHGARLLPNWAELFSPAGYLRLWPHRHRTDGFFAARLQRTDR